MNKKSFAVIGLGQFGSAVVEELVRNGMDVIAIDSSEEAVSKISPLLPTCFIADCTNEVALQELGIKDVDVAIVAFGDNKEASVLTTVLLRELGVKTIIVRVDDPFYIQIMKKLGATEVITPQKAAGIALANRIGSDDVKDFYKLDKNYSIVSLAINSGFIPTKLKDFQSKANFGVNIVLVIRNEQSFVPGGSDTLLPNDTLFIVGTTKDINNFREAINGDKKKAPKKKKEVTK